jgi:hypothetical protein
MDNKEIVEVYRIRSRRAAICRYAVCVLLPASSFLLALSDPFTRAPRASWQSVLLIAAVLLAASCPVLFFLSVAFDRCPGCSRMLLMTGKALFCPACGARLAFERGAFPGHSEKREKASPDRPLWMDRAVDQLADEREYPGEKYPKGIRLFTTGDELQLTRRYARLIDQDDALPADHKAGSGGPKTLWGRFLNKVAIAPVKGTPGEHLYRNIGLWAGVCLAGSFVIFFLHLLGVLPGDTALGMIVTLLLYCLAGAVLFFLNQSGDWRNG